MFDKFLEWTQIGSNWNHTGGHHSPANLRQAKDAAETEPLWGKKDQVWKADMGGWGKGNDYFKKYLKNGWIIWVLLSPSSFPSSPVKECISWMKMNSVFCKEIEWYACKRLGLQNRRGKRIGAWGRIKITTNAPSPWIHNFALRLQICQEVTYLFLLLKISFNLLWSMGHWQKQCRQKREKCLCIGAHTIASLVSLLASDWMIKLMPQLSLYAQIIANQLLEVVSPRLLAAADHRYVRVQRTQAKE